MILPAHICATRRHMLGAMARGVPGIAMMATSLLAMGLPHRAARAQALSGAFADGAQMTVAGPEGGELDHWSRVILPALGAFPPARQDRAAPQSGGWC